MDESIEYLVMENGSEKLYKTMPYRRDIRYFHSKKRGLGWALRYGIQLASWPYAFFLPADNSYDLSFVRQAMGFLDTGYDLVLGSKAIEDSKVSRPVSRQMISVAYNLVWKLRYGPKWPNDITGVKGYNRKAILPLLDRPYPEGIGFEVELMKEVLTHNLRSKEIAVKVRDYRPSKFNPFLKAGEKLKRWNTEPL